MIYTHTVKSGNESVMDDTDGLWEVRLILGLNMPISIVETEDEERARKVWRACNRFVDELEISL